LYSTRDFVSVVKAALMRWADGREM